LGGAFALEASASGGLFPRAFFTVAKMGQVQFKPEPPGKSSPENEDLYKSLTFTDLPELLR
jgi:hypothetical protein